MAATLAGWTNKLKLSETRLRWDKMAFPGVMLAGKPK
jgi:hypothetical protein